MSPGCWGTAVLTVTPSAAVTSNRLCEPTVRVCTPPALRILRSTSLALMSIGIVAKHCKRQATIHRLCRTHSARARRDGRSAVARHVKLSSRWKSGIRAASRGLEAATEVHSRRGLAAGCLTRTRGCEQAGTGLRLVEPARSHERELGAVLTLELAHESGDVLFHRGLAEVEAAADRGVGCSCRHEP